MLNYRIVKYFLAGIALLLLCAAPSMAGPMFMTFGTSADSYGANTGTVLAPPGTTFTAYLYVAMDTNAGVNWTYTTAWLSWDTSELTLTDSQYILPPAATADGGIALYYGTANVNKGFWAGQQGYNPYPKMQSSQVFRYTFLKLTGNNATVTLKADTTPAGFGITGSNIADDNPIETCPFAVYSLNVASVDTYAPIIQAATLGTLLNAETKVVTGITVYDSAAATGNTSCSLWVHPGTGGTWQAVPATQTNYSGTTATFSCTIPAGYIATPYIYYFLSATDSWGNNGKLPAAANFTDTTGADSQVVYSNVPLTLTGVGRGSTYFTDSKPVTVHYATNTDSVYIWVSTSADSVYVLNRTLGAFGDTEAIFSNADTATTSLIGCTVPLAPDTLNYIVVVGVDGVMPWSTSETFAVWSDTGAPAVPAVIVNNNAGVIGSYSANLSMIANDTRSGTLKFYVDACTQPNGVAPSTVDSTFVKGQNMALDTGVMALPPSNSDSNYIYFYVIAEDSAGNYDGANAALTAVIIDTTSPRVYFVDGGVLSPYSAPGDSQIRTGEALDLTLAVADSSAISAAYIYFRHPNIGVVAWQTETFALLGSLAGDFKLYGCSIPLAVVGQAGTNDCTGGIQMFGYLTDALGKTTWIDSRGATLNETMPTIAGQQASGFDTIIAADSVMIIPSYITNANLALGVPLTALNWHDTVYANATDSVHIRVFSNADTVSINGYGVMQQWGQTTGHIGANGWYDTLPFAVANGRNVFRLIGNDAAEPERNGVNDTITIIIDTYLPVIHSVLVETGSVGMDSGATPSLFVRVNAADTLGYDTTGIGGLSPYPSFLVVSDTYFPNPGVLVALDTLAGHAYVKQAYGSGIVTMPWTAPDTTVYSVYAYVIDRANNVSLPGYDNLNHDTLGPQVNYAGVSDNRSATQPVTVTLNVTDAGGDAFVGKVWLYYSHPTGYPALATWEETVCANTALNTWTGYIPATAVGGIADTTAGVKYFIRTSDTINNFAYWGDLDGVAGGALGMYDTTATDTTNGDARFKSNYYFDTFSVVLSVPVAASIWDTAAVTQNYGLTRVGFDTRTLASGLFISSDSMAIRIGTGGIADTITVYNVGVMDTVTWDSANMNAAGDSIFRIPLQTGVNTILITATDTDMPSFYQVYTLTADTGAPLLLDGRLAGRIYMNPLNNREYTDSSSLVLLATVADSYSGAGALSYRIGEDSTFTTGANPAWQAYAASLIYPYVTQDTVPFWLQFRDAAGNMNDSAAVQIYVDTQGPLTAMAAAISDSRTANATLNFNITLRDESGDTPQVGGTRGFIWYSNPNQYVGGIVQSTAVKWDSQPVNYSGAGVTWSCSIPQGVIGASPDSSVAWFIQSYDTWNKVSYLVGVSGTTLACYTETMTLAQALASPDTFTTVDKVVITTYLRDASDSLAGQVVAYSGRTIDSDILYLRFVTDADTVVVYISNDALSVDSAASACSPGIFVPGGLAQQDTVVISGKLRPGLNYVYVRATDGDYPTANDTYIIVCDTVAPNVALARLTLADNNLSNYVATDTLGLRAWFTASDSTTAIGYYRLSVTTPITSAWTAFVSPLLGLSETVAYYAATGTTIITVYAQVADTAGNISDTFTDTILYDTIAPDFIYAGVADSRAAGYAVTVMPQISDLSGTAAITAYLYFQHDTGNATWDSVPMNYTNNGLFFTGDIPSGYVGSAPDSTFPMNSYVIAAKDWFDQWRYYGSNGDSAFASLAAAKLQPDSFTTVTAIAMSVYALNTALNDTQTMADSIYTNANGLTLRVISPNADTITIAHYRAQAGWVLVDTFTAGNITDTYQPVTRLAPGINVFVIIAEDSAAQAEPTARRVYAIYADTYAPFTDTNVLTAGDTIRIDTGLTTTQDTNVVLYLNLSDTDNGNNVPGGVSFMSLSETIAFNDSAATGWIAYTTPYTHGFRNADGDSMLTLYLRFKDAAGNTTPVAWRSIYWDTVAPAIVFTAIGDSRPTNRAVAITATSTDLSGTATMGIVTYHPSTQAGWETWPLTASGPNTFVGSIPDTVVGGAASLTGVRYYLVATDSWGQTTYWVDNGVVANRQCTSVVYARTLWFDTFTVSLPVTTTSSARDFDTLTYTTLVSYGAGWSRVYYRADSFSIKVTTNADSLAVYIRDWNRALVWSSDTFWLTQGAVSQDTYIDLSTHLIDDTCFIQVVGFDYTEPMNADTFAVIGDTRVPYFGTTPVIDAGLYASGDTTLAVTFVAADTYSVAYYIVSETHPQFFTDTESRKVAYATSANYTLTKDTQFVTLYVAVFDTAGNWTVATENIWLDTYPPAVTFAGVADSRSANQRVAVQPTINDLSGTITATLYFFIDTSATWGSVGMSAIAGGTYLGYIPAHVVGTDTTSGCSYVIQATDTFNRTTWWGANGDSYFTTLAAAQAKPDTFNIVTPVPTTLTIKDGNDTIARAIAYSGQWFNHQSIGLVITTSADTIAIAVKQSGGADSFVWFSNLTVADWSGDSVNKVGSPFSCTFPVQWLTQVCTFTITIAAGDSDGGTPQFLDSWEIIVDTAAPRYGLSRIGSSAATDTFIGSVSQSVTFIAQDSNSVSFVTYSGDVSAGAATAYTGAAQTVTFSAGEGWKSLNYFFTDAAGNASVVFGDSYYLDITSGTVTVTAVPYSAAAAWTCTGTVVDNRIDTPGYVSFLVNGTASGTVAVTPVSGAFSSVLPLSSGINLVRVTATDSAGNSSFDEFTVTYATVAVVVTGTTPVAITISDTAGGTTVVPLGASDSCVLSITNAAGTDTLVANIDFKLVGYIVTVQRLDSNTLTASLGASGNLNGVTTTNYLALDSFVVKFTATDSQGNPVADNSSTPYDGVTLTWYYGGSVTGSDETNLHVFIFDPADSKWKQATTVSGLAVAWPDGGAAGERQSTTNDTLSLRVSHLSIWGVFLGGAPLAGNLDNVQIFPNPFKPYDGLASTGEPYDNNPNGMTGIRFVNLAANTEIKIYTINGELVDEVTMVANQGLAIWDARNKGNDEVASGIYLVVFKANGQVVVRKLAIIR